MKTIEIKPITKKYKCDYCNKKAYISKYKCQEHEDKCFKNPNRNCPTCTNTGVVEVWMDNAHGGLDEIKQKCNSCMVAQELGGKSYI